MFFWRIWLIQLLSHWLAVRNPVTNTLHPVPECGLLERVGFLHRCLPHPAQCETPGTEVEARVAEEQLLSAQGEVAVLGPGRIPVLVTLRGYVPNTKGIEKQLEGPSCGLPVPV